MCALRCAVHVMGHVESDVQQQHPLCLKCYFDTCGHKGNYLKDQVRLSVLVF